MKNKDIFFSRYLRTLVLGSHIDFIVYNFNDRLQGSFHGMSKKSVRPNRGARLRTRTKNPRNNFMDVEVTPDERNRINAYCHRYQISASEFLAQVLLEDAIKLRPAEKMILKPEIALTADQYEKLELLTILYEKTSIDDLIHSLILEKLEVQKVRTGRKRTFLRFYVSPEEHAIISSYIAAKKVSGNKYAAMIAVKALNREWKKTDRENRG
jgi:hypothetical protein